ncbi:MAG: substrate-binding domain-containing protein [Candidatus Limnocylindrales bacterium]|jgi:tungstate transport system substrate-binding protein|nr:substrate-binding domain-containing protein [Candidatus Limnocylindrales bacterium]
MAPGALVAKRGLLKAATMLATVVLVAGACSSSTASPQASAPAPSAAASAAASPSAGPAGSTNLILATTTSLQDSGLLDVLVPAFEKASGYTVKTVAVGTGQALTMGQQGNADVLFVHAPTQEQAFMDAGWGVDRRLVAHNYFWIVGPASDPAAISGMTSAVDAFKKIAASGATFVSRGDNSGTNTKELALWKTAGITPKGSWYIESGQGMGATLQIASEKAAYTLTDTATFLSNQANLALKALVKSDSSLINIYSVIAVNPAKWPKVNVAGAKAFEDYVTGTAGQQIIATFGIDTFGIALFNADAGKDYSSLQ